MSSRGDDFFARLRQQQRAVDEARRQGAYEEAVIKRLLAHGGIRVNFKQAVEDVRATFKSDFLTFLWFNDAYPRFPVRLGAAKLRGTSGTRIGWTELFGSGFRRLPWMREYQAMCEQYDYDPAREHVGLVFNAPHADKAATMVMHNMANQLGGMGEDARHDGETRIMRTFRRPAMTYVIESFTGFLTTVGKDWGPE
jgi:hypothetical protein